MDGTLVDTEPYWIETEYELVEAYGGTWTDEHALRLVGNDLLDSAALHPRARRVPLGRARSSTACSTASSPASSGSVPWRPGARRLLAELNAAGVPCALVTMSWRRFVDPILAELPPGSFEAIVTGEEVTPRQAPPRALPASPPPGSASTPPTAWRSRTPTPA